MKQLVLDISAGMVAIGFVSTITMWIMVLGA